MLVRVNKRISAREYAKYAALATGTISHVWYDEDSTQAASPKRRNRIDLTHDDFFARPETNRSYDA